MAKNFLELERKVSWPEALARSDAMGGELEIVLRFKEASVRINIFAQV